MPNIITNVSNLHAPGGSQVTFLAKLSDKPKRRTRVNIERTSGSPSIQLASSNKLLFDEDSYDGWRQVSLSSDSVSSGANAETTYTLTAEGMSPATVTAYTGSEASGALPVTSGTRIVIDPVTRIEGHLRIEVEIREGRVGRAWSTGTLFRGIEKILQGRDPKDAPLITQRLCGVCTFIHSLCSVRCIEDAASVTLPENARILRNLMLGAQFLHDHIVHFYHLHGMDWIDIVSALEADPGQTESLARSLSQDAPVIDFAAVQNKLKTFANSGKLGPFANAYWGHEAYRLSPEANLALAAHYLEALTQQARTATMHAIFGGKNPHPQSIIVGGMTCAGEVGNPASIEEFRSYLAETRRFVNAVYLPDVRFLVSQYPEWTQVGGYEHLMSFGDFPLSLNEPADLFIPRGIVYGGDVFNVRPVEEAKVAEFVGRSWYRNTGGKHPSRGETQPQYNGLDTNGQYSWCKAPRYDGVPMEVGPLARVLVAYGQNHPEMVGAVDRFLGDTGLRIEELFSTMGRTAARALETQLLADAMEGWIDELERNIAGNVQQMIQPHTAPREASGVGLNEAPRGALGHWMDISGSKIGNYQMVVPSTWNFSPRCDNNLPGPMERALVGVEVKDASQPVEVLRVIHSFDPCLACAVHVTDVKSRQKYRIQVL